MVWVSVEERLPDKDGLVLVCCPTWKKGKPFISMAWYDPNGFGWSLLSETWIEAIAYWMPLPEPPEGL